MPVLCRLPDIGIQTERHALTIAGARMGKGSALIIPNLLRWLHSSVVIDPKGENAERTWEARHNMGQAVGLIDPFLCADVPPALRVSVNVLDTIDPDSLTARADILAVTDGMVKRSNPHHAEFDDAAVKILAGVTAYVLLDSPPEHRNLSAVRGVLLQEDGQPTKEGEKPFGL